MDKKKLKPTGKLFTSNPAGLKNLEVEAELWQIMRAGHTLPNCIEVKTLSPSKPLFLKYNQEWKGLPYQEWWPKYEKQFNEELKKEAVLQSLRDIYRKLLAGTNVVLICFCNDHRYCHRRLVAEFFKPYGVEPKELNPVKVEQLSIFSEEYNDY